MLAKIYWYTWLVVITAFALVFVTGNMSDLMWSIFGFTAFGMVFTGMINVLPAAISEPPPPDRPIDKIEAGESAPASTVRHQTQPVRI